MPKEGLEARIGERIRREGPITFATFMEMALYDPQDGYYASPPAGEDFYTSPMAHPVFSALLAIQLEQIWQALGQPRHFPVVEMGAGHGLQAQSIQEFAWHLAPGFARSLHYVPVERTWGSLPIFPIVGCFLSNELLDAFPTHVVVQQDGELQEVYVGVKEGRLVEVLGEPTPGLQAHLAREGIILPDGYRTEVNLEIPGWMAQVSRALHQGLVLTIDYGYLAQDLYAPRRRRGTLLCYHRHTYHENPLIHIGCQDITSHVDFTAVIQAGEENGLDCLGLVPQGEFLTNLGLGAFLRSLAQLGLEPGEYQANAFAMRELVRPDGMGGFRVLAQGRGLRGLQLWGLTPGNEKLRELQSRKVPVPRLRPEHLPLFQARYPHQGWS